MSDDPEDEQPKHNLGQTFSFRGQPLAPYSFCHRAALLRTGALNDYEFCTYLIRLLLMPVKAVDALRDEGQLAAFRLSAGEWADQQGVANGQGLKDIQDLAAAITKGVIAAQQIQPAPVKKSQGRSRDTTPTKGSRT